MLRIAPSLVWLRAAGREYPVTIDPTITTRGAATDCFIATGDPNAPHCGGTTAYTQVGVENGSKKRGLLKFNLSGLPENALITDADLSLYLEANQTTTGANANYVVKSPSKSWVQGATWNSPNGTSTNLWAGGSPGSTVWATRDLMGGTAGYKHWDTTDLVDRRFSDPVDNTGFLLKQENETVNNLLSFTSSEAGNPQSKWPTLVIEYTPVAIATVAEPEGHINGAEMTDQELDSVGVSQDMVDDIMNGQASPPAESETLPTISERPADLDGDESQETEYIEPDEDGKIQAPDASYRPPADRYDIVGHWYDDESRPVWYRKGYYHKGSGFGYRKIIERHNVWAKIIRYTTERTMFTGRWNGTSRDYFMDWHLMECRGYWPFRHCTTIDTIRTKVIVDHRRLRNGNGETFGIVNAWCEDYWECPRWVNRAPV